MTPDETDRLILNRLQDGFPIAPEPYLAVADQIGLTERQLLTRLAAMKDAGIITRFGPFFDAAEMGGAFCLCAMSVPAEDFARVATMVNSFPEVAHNYERTHNLNMWFVLATETEADIDVTARRIEVRTGFKVLLFPKLQEFFIGFRVAA